MYAAIFNWGLTRPDAGCSSKPRNDLPQPSSEFRRTIRVRETARPTIIWAESRRCKASLMRLTETSIELYGTSSFELLRIASWPKLIAGAMTFQPHSITRKLC